MNFYAYKKNCMKYPALFSDLIESLSHLKKMDGWMDKNSITYLSLTEFTKRLKRWFDTLTVYLSL